MVQGLSVVGARVVCELSQGCLCGAPRLSVGGARVVCELSQGCLWGAPRLSVGGARVVCGGGLGLSVS